MFIIAEISYILKNFSYKADHNQFQQYSSLNDICSTDYHEIDAQSIWVKMVTKARQGCLY